MTTNETEEKAYMAESLNFINSVDLTYSYKYKDSFTPVLTKIVNGLVEDESLIEHMNKMITKKREDNSNSNLKELIVKLSQFDEIRGKFIQSNHNGDNAKYVEQCLKIIGISRSKKVIYELFNLVMQDLEKPENTNLMKKVKNLKKNNPDWKKMVGMLIPPGAQVKLTRGIFEPFTQFAVGTHRNKHTPLTSREPIVTVVKRGKLDGTLIGGNFQKVVRLPNEIRRKDNLAYKDGEIMVDPGDIEFPDSQPESETGQAEAGEGQAEAVEGTEEAPVTEEASAAAAAALVAAAASGATEEVIAPAGAAAGATAVVSGATTATETGESVLATEEVIVPEHKQQGGQQRTTRKHKNAIIGSAKKSRTNR